MSYDMRAKLKRLAEVELMPNIIQEGNPLFDTIKGNWHKDFYKNNNPIVLELACGRGEYTIGLAQKDSGRNYLGVDIKGDRIWKGASMALTERLTNVGFLRANIRNLDQFFELDETGEIWITFPDPFPKNKDEKHRLTNTHFLDLYKQLLTKEGWIRFKTDNTFLFEYTLEVLASRVDIKALEYTHDLYNSPLKIENFGIQTRFEQKFSTLGEKIKYLKFKFL